MLSAFGKFLPRIRCRRILEPEDIPIATKTMEERKEALNMRTLGKRSKITLCLHGINKKYCTPCNTKKAPKSKKAKVEPPVMVEQKPSAE